MVMPTNPASPSRAEKPASHLASHESTAGSQPNSARSATRNSRIADRIPASSGSLAQSASNSVTGHDTSDPAGSRNCHVHPADGRPYSITVSEGARRDRLRELLDAVVDADNTNVGEMARSSYASEFHFSREVRRLTGESPAALRLHRGQSVSAVAADEGWSSAEVFSRAFSRTFGVPPSQAAEVEFRLPA